ncbi:hypothetical protein EVB99_105 [Rhizobium phage RHph_N3_19]|nr:hypothetical protein EVB99_105 [Rhizobium phage RHph_N3_19]
MYIRYSFKEANIPWVVFYVLSMSVSQYVLTSPARKVIQELTPADC